MNPTRPTREGFTWLQYDPKNLQDIEDFLGGKAAYDNILKINWGNGSVKIRTSWGWMGLEKWSKAYIVKGADDFLFIVPSALFAAYLELEAENAALRKQLEKLVDYWRKTGPLKCQYEKVDDLMKPIMAMVTREGSDE